jgi:hypothetical protein
VRPPGGGLPAPALRGLPRRDARCVQLLDSSEGAIRHKPRLGSWGFGIDDVRIHALRGDKAKALAALREAEQTGWRGPIWRLSRDFAPSLASIRDEPEFKAVFADIERDLALQRAKLAKLPKDAPLDLAAGNSERARNRTYARVPIGSCFLLEGPLTVIVMLVLRGISELRTLRHTSNRPGTDLSIRARSNARSARS